MTAGVAAGADLSWPLARATALRRDEVAVTAAGRAVTYGQLSQRVVGLGAGLASLGVAPGERVAFLGANSLAHLECWLGVPAAGRVLVDLNLRLAADELAFMTADCGARVLIHDAANAEVAAALREQCPELRALVSVDLDAPDAVGYEHLVTRHASPSDGDPRALDPGTLAAISYTGGTTGRPKGVMLSHANLAANALHNLLITGHRGEDTFLHVCPMFHVAGISNIFAATWVGARQVVLPRFDAAAVTDTVAAERIALTTLVPTMLQMWLTYLATHPGADLSSLRNLHYAGSPISPELQRRVCETLTCEIAQMYGMTEAAPTVTHLSPEVHRRGLSGEEPERTRLSSMGVAVVGVRAEVRDPTGGGLPAGEIGEVWVSGPNVMLGYWNLPEATRAVLVGGWYRTGDAAYADEGGYLFMVDRIKDMIITGGENVYSIEVENVLVSLDGVSEAAVFGVPDPHWGERVHAVVVVAADAELTEETLGALCRERIAGFKVPRSFQLRSEPLPKSGAGKVLKTPLREPFWEDAERRVG